MPDLHTLQDEALVDTIRDLLDERGNAAAVIDRRAGELPFHPLLDAYEKGTEATRDRIRRATLRLLRDSGNTEWPSARLQYLLAFVERAKLTEMAEPVEILLDRWSRQADSRKRRALGLRTLLGIGWLGTLAFWQEQTPALATSAPDLLFRGFRGHGLSPAFDALPRLTQDPIGMRKILAQFPAMIQEHGSDVVVRHACIAMPQLTDSSVAELRHWLSSRPEIAQQADSSQAKSERRSAIRSTSKAAKGTAKRPRRYVVRRGAHDTTHRRKYDRRPKRFMPGELPAFAGIYEERDGDGRPVRRPKQIKVTQADEPLPPTQKEGWTWTLIGRPRQRPRPKSKSPKLAAKKA